MLKINGKTFMNIEEAVQWLLDNNALPYQSSANYVADTEIGLGTISNPSPAKVRIGSLILFADGKVGTVTGLTSNSFIVGSEYTDLSNTAKYVVSAMVDDSGDLIFTLSDGSTINAGLIKQISSFAISGTNLIAYYNDGTSSDCGPLFVGSLTLPADLTVTDDLTVGGDSTFGQIANFNGNVVISTGKNLTVGGNANFQTATFNDVATFADEAIFSNPVTINDNLAIDGDISTTRDASIGGDLLVAGNTDLTGDLDVSGDAKLFENIVDKDGHKRFFEDAGYPTLISGITYVYSKYSLSGTHLLIVLALNVANGTVITGGAKAMQYNLPQWIMDKIVALYGTTVSTISVDAFDSAGNTQLFKAYLTKSADGTHLTLRLNGFTATADRSVRLGFDLLIDNA